MGTESGARPGLQAPPGTAGRPGGPGQGMQSARPPAYGQGLIVSVVVAAAVFVLAIIAFGDADESRLPIAQTTGVLFWALAVLVIVAAGFGAQYVERTAAQAAASLGRQRPDAGPGAAWAVPVVATFAAIFMVATYHNQVMLAAGPAIAFFGNAGALLSRDLLDDAGDSAHRTATTIHTLVIHAVAFLALSALYLNKMSSWALVPLVGIVSALLVLETLERASLDPERRLLYALVGGVALAEAALAVNWWPTHGWTGGAVLLVCFYLASGVILAFAQRSAFRSRDLVEFGLVSLIAFVVLAVTA